MAKYKIIGVRPKNQLLDCFSDSEDYELTYLKKAWYYFGKVRTIKRTVSCPDFARHSWIKSIEEKIELGEWRKN